MFESCNKFPKTFFELKHSYKTMKSKTVFVQISDISPYRKKVRQGKSRFVFEHVLVLEPSLMF